MVDKLNLTEPRSEIARNALSYHERLTLRAAVVEDAPSVAEVFLSSRKAFLPYARLAHSEAEVREWIRQALIPSDGVTVACLDERVVGMVAVSRQAGRELDRPTVRGATVCRSRHWGASARSRPFRVAPSGPALHFPGEPTGTEVLRAARFKAVAFTDGAGNEEQCPDVLYELHPL